MRQAEVRFDGEPNSVATARQFVTELLESAGAIEEIWTAAQVVSELATNAVVHADTDFVVRVTIGGTAIRIGVTDYRPFGALTERPFSTEDTTGRGLRLVDMLSCSWGVRTAERSKTVWCEILRTTSGGSSGTLHAAAVADVDCAIATGTPLARA